MAYWLSGEYDFGPKFTSKYTADLSRFRCTPILASDELTAERRGEITSLLSAHSNFGGEPMRCFIPRHGVSFANGPDQVDVLLCFECFLAYSFRGEEKDWHTLSEIGVQRMKAFFDELEPDSLIRPGRPR